MGKVIPFRPKPKPEGERLHIQILDSADEAIQRFHTTREVEILDATGRKMLLPKGAEVRFGIGGDLAYWNREIQPLVDNGTLVRIT